MKRFAAAAIAAVMVCETAVNVLGNDISVVLNGDTVKFEGAEPVIFEGRTLIPVRGVFEQLGYEVSWDNETKTALFTGGGNEIAIQAENKYFTVNGEERELDVPAKIIDGSMLLPLRAVGEAAGLEVSWDSESKTAGLTVSADSGEAETADGETEMETEKADDTNEEKTAAYEVSDEELNRIKALAADYTDGLVLYRLFNSFKYNEKDSTRRSNELITKRIDDKFGYMVNVAPFVYKPLDTEDSVIDWTTGGKFGLYESSSAGYAFYGAPTSEEYERRSKLVGSFVMTEMYKIESETGEEIKNYEEILNNIEKSGNETGDFIGEFTDMTVNVQAFHNKRAELYLQPNNLYNTDEKIDEFMEDTADCPGEYEAFDIADFAEAVNNEMKKETYYNYTLSSLESSEQAEVKAYRKKISEVYCSALSFFKDEEQYSNAEAYLEAEKKIRLVLDETEAPERCLMDREILYKCCEYLKVFAEDIENGVEPEEVYSNENTVEYIAYFAAFNRASYSALGSYFGETDIYGFKYEYFEPYRLYTAKTEALNKNAVYRADYISRQ